MEWWPLPIFPDGSLASSVITTVWAGVFVVCLFNLRFGWVLSGLVVPGYVVPLLIAKPLSAAVVLLEASITYLLFWLVSERMSGPARWSSFFGRDRFMGLILVSVAVRLLLDGWLLPMAAHELDQRYGLQVDWQHNLHSFGLIVVALLANQLWKPGYVRGMTQALVMIGITYLIIRYGLMELTNFRIGAVVYLYEDFASSVLASPKAYIILITTCFIASRMNLRYGWDFSGILIPALLALQWYQPWKILTSMVEAVVIYIIASALLASRIFRGTTVEGARKTLLFFNISFAYKLLLGHALTFAAVEHRITDYYGFGYLLPTLIALKAHDKDILARVSRATVQISFMGALAGSLAGFVLTFILPVRVESAAGSDGTQQPFGSGRVIAAAAGASRLEAAVSATGVAARHAVTFRQALALMDRGRTDGEARALLKEAGFALLTLADGRRAVRPKAGGGFALLFDPSAGRRLAVHVPSPSQAPGLALAGLSLFEREGARWLVVGGNSPPANRQGGRAPAAEFARALDVQSVAVRAVRGDVPQLQLVGGSADQLDLRQMRNLLPDLAIAFGDVEADASVLMVPPAAVQRMIAGGGPTRASAHPERFTLEELAFIHFDLLEPLISGSATSLAAARSTAASAGIELGLVDIEKGERLIGLRRAGHPSQLYLLRPRGSGPVLQLPADEGVRSTAAQIFRRLDGRAMLTVPDSSALEGEEAQLLALITQALLRSAPAETATLQVRRHPNYARQRGPLLAVDRIEPAGGFGDRLLNQLRRTGISASLIGRDPASAGLEIGRSAPLRYVQQAQGGRAAILWLESDQ